MSGNGTLHGTSDGGVAGQHDPVEAPEFLVGTTTSSEFNTAHLRLIPVACFRVDDIRFDFDSSFVTSNPGDENKDIRAELKILVSLLKDHPQSPLSVFGHADPVGSDDYNKLLSGRRATVIYALLLSSTDPDTAVSLWQGVSSTENWGSRQRQAMQSFTGLSNTTGAPLYKAYMQKLCPPELKLGKTDFLGQGADTGGKGDYQGCSEFNPTLIFSEQKNSVFESAQDKTARNDANAPNRRVLVLLFRKGSKIVPEKWPCPRVKEGIAGCQKRFWSDGETRRSTRLPDKDRLFDTSKDTFACRFYQRLLTNSPCESPLKTVKIRLFDPQARPLPFAPCLVTHEGSTQPDRATGAPPSPAGTTPAGTQGSVSDVDSGDGYITVRVVKFPETIKLNWSRAKATEGADAPLPEVGTDLENSYKFEFQTEVTVDIPDADPQTASPLRLGNLSYSAFPSETENVQDFQQDYKNKYGDLGDSGSLDQPTTNAIQTSHDSCEPVLKAGCPIVVTR
jgi:hypothetical protein